MSGEVVQAQPGFRTGLTCLFGGLKWLATTSAAWPRAAVPMVLAMIVSVGLSGLSIAYVPDLVGAYFGADHGQLAQVGIGVLKVVITILAIAASALVAFALAQPLSGMALEGIVRLREADLGAPTRPPTSFAADIGRSLQSLVVGYAFGVPALLGLFALSLIVPMASVILFPLKLFVAAMTVAWDICDYPLSVRGLRVSRRVALMRHHWRPILGFGIGLALTGLIPCALLLFLPGGVAGAAQLMWTIEQWERTQGRGLFEVSPAPAALPA
ncbi:MAG: EI24 domain-containing protein [Polyangiaceae bacterium]